MPPYLLSASLSSELSCSEREVQDVLNNGVLNENVLNYIISGQPQPNNRT